MHVRDNGKVPLAQAVLLADALVMLFSIIKGAEVAHQYPSQ